MWQPQVEALKDTYHILAPDLPEHGQSLEVKPFTMQGAAEQVSGLIKTSAHGGRAYVVGLSLGAQVTVALLAAAPEVVTSALVSSALLRPAPGAWMYTPGVLRWAHKTSVAPFRNADWWINLNSKYAAGIPAAYYPQAKADFQRLSEDAWTHVMTENLKFRLPAGLEKVNVPTQVVAGKGEYGAMKQSARDLAAALPNARGYLVTHRQKLSLAQQHNWNLNAPDLFTRTVRAWIEDKPLPDELKPLS
jgi:pimeloyl-ACP methyl ester carboxylesterase